MRELRVAVRSLVRQPGMAALAVVALGLGIGLTTTMFSIVNGAVLRGLPFPESDRILHMAPFNIAEQDDRDANIHTFAELRDRQRSFEQLAAFQFQSDQHRRAERRPGSLRRRPDHRQHLSPAADRSRARPGSSRRRQRSGRGAGRDHRRQGVAGAVRRITRGHRAGASRQRDDHDGGGCHAAEVPLSREPRYLARADRGSGRHEIRRGARSRDHRTAAPGPLDG